MKQRFWLMVALGCSIALAFVTVMPPTVPSDWARLDANGVYVPPGIAADWPPYALQVGLWLAVLAALVMSVAQRFLRNPYPPNPLSPYTEKEGVRIAADKALHERGKRKLYIYIAAITAITLLGFGLRLRGLDDLPLIIDEIGFAAHASDILHGQAIPIFAPGHNEFPTVYSWLMAESMALFGQNRFAMRLVMLAFGTLSIPALYVLGRAWFSRRVGLVAAAFLATWPAHIFFSRMALNNLADPMFAMLALAALARGIRAGDGRRDFMLAGMWAGVAQYFYSGSRLLLILLVVYALLEIRRKKRNAEKERDREAEGNLFLRFSAPLFICVALFIMVLPRFAPILTGQASLMGYSRPGLPADALANTLRAVGAWVGQADVSPFWLSDAPLLAWLVLGVLGAGALIGLYSLLTPPHNPIPVNKEGEPERRARCWMLIRGLDARFVTLMLWVVLVTIFGGVVWPAAPLYVRYLTAAPAVGLLVAVSIQFLANSERFQAEHDGGRRGMMHHAPTNTSHSGWALGTRHGVSLQFVIILIIVVQGIYAAHNHLHEAQGRITAGQWEEDRLARAAAALPDGEAAVLTVSADFGRVERVTIAHHIAAYGTRRMVIIMDEGG